MKTQDKGRFEKAPSQAMIEAVESRLMLAGHVLKDINVTPTDPYGPPSSPSPAYTFGNIALFAQATDDFANVELWKTDGTASGTSFLKDINSGYLPSAPSNFVTFNGYAYFVAHVGPTANTYQLWRTDGTVSGTTSFAYYNPADNTSLFNSTYVTDATVVGSKMYFITNDATTGGKYLWSTDGTTAGTVLVKDLPFTTNQRVETTATDGSKLYFQVYDMSQNKSSLWISDGSSAGTVSLVTVNGFQTPLCPLGTGIYFVDLSGQLWRSFGTAATTTKTGVASPTTTSDSPSHGSIVSAGGVLYIADGTIYSFTPGSSPPVLLSYGTSTVSGASQLITSNNAAYLVAASTTQGTNAFAFTDVFKASATGVTPMITPAASMAFSNLTAVGGKLFFLENGSQLGSMLATPGASVTLVNVLNAAGNVPQGFTSFGSSLLFDNWDSVHGWDLWKTDGTAANTAVIADVNPSDASSQAGWYTNFGNSVIFSADDGVHGMEPWITDGSAGGTSMLADLVPGSSGSYVNDLVPMGNLIYLTNGNNSVWVSDGTNFGTILLNPTVPFRNLSEFMPYNGKMYFSATDATSTALWQSDGTVAGTFKVSSFGASATRYCYPGAVVNGKLIVVKDYQMYAFTGDASTAPLLYDSTGYCAHFQTIANQVYFTGYDPAHGYELWRSDGTLAGTALFADVVPGTESSEPAGYSNDDPSFIKFNGEVYFEATSVAHGRELYAVDALGSSRMVADLAPGTGDSSPVNMRIYNNKLYFIAAPIYNSPFFNPTALYCTDGTPSGTSLVLGGTNQFYVSSLQLLNDELVTIGGSANDYSVNIYVSDGTTIGSTSLQWTYRPVNSSLSGSPVAFPNGDFLTSASEGYYGLEPWIFTPDIAPTINSSLTGGQLSIFGAAGRIDLSDGNGVITVQSPGQIKTYSSAGITNIIFNSSAGTDSFTVDSHIGQPISVAGANGGSDLITVTGNGSVSASTDLGDIDTNLKLVVDNGGIATFSSPERFADLNVAGMVSLLGSGTFALKVQEFTCSGQLDLQTHPLIIDYYSSSPISAMPALITSGKIVSSTIAANPSLTALGYVEAWTKFGPGGGTFAAMPVDNTAVIVACTYFGDADLNGTVNGNDYTQIDFATSHPALTGWQYGDFNYDGKIDGSDYSLIDNAFNRQASSLASGSANVAASSPNAVPTSMWAQPMSGNRPQTFFSDTAVSAWRKYVDENVAQALG